MTLNTYTNRQANALTTDEWHVVAQYLNEYVAEQDYSIDDGEAGYLIDSIWLKESLDSDGNGIFLGEGDDTANVPVLVDVYDSSSTWIPGTSSGLRFPASSAASISNADALMDEVQKHENAGFSTDIIVYSNDGSTQSPVVMSYGAMSHANYFSVSAPPNVYGLKWGRGGWGTPLSQSYTNTKNITDTPATPNSNTLATNSICSGITPDSEMVRCVAAQALASLTFTEAWDASEDGNYLPVDLRTSLADTSTLANQTDSSAYAIQNPLQTLFDSTNDTYDNLSYLDSGGIITNIFVNRTHHTAGMAAQGARMLGYNASYLKWGLPGWNNTLDEEYDGDAGYAYTSEFDTTNPTIISGVEATPFDIIYIHVTWMTDEPATSMIQYGTSSGGPYTQTINDTILHESHDVSITGLNPGQTYYFKVSSYDGMANGTTSEEHSMELPPISYDLDVNITPSGGGFVTGSDINCPSDCSGPYDPSTTIILTADPNIGYVLGGWNGCNVEIANQCTIIMNANKIVTANFNLIEGDDIINMFDVNVLTGDIQGIGNRKSADHKMNALRNKIKEAKNLIDNGDIAGACNVLQGAYLHCDGKPVPPDFVEGNSQAELSEMIKGLMLNIGCQ